MGAIDNALVEGSDELLARSSMYASRLCLRCLVVVGRHPSLVVVGRHPRRMNRARETKREAICRDGSGVHARYHEFTEAQEKEKKFL